MNKAAKSTRARSTFSKDMRLMNKYEDIHLQQELDLIDRKCRAILTALSQDRDSLVKDHKKILHLKVCEPRATVDNTMREIMESKEANFDLLCLTFPPQTSQNRLHSSKSLLYQRDTTTLISRRSKSAYAFVSNTRGGNCSSLMTQQEDNRKTMCLSPRRLKSTATFSKQLTKKRSLESKSQVLSIMQLKQMATIDNISEKELASQQERVIQERERLKLIIREKLHQKIQTFLQKLDVPDNNMPTKPIGRNVNCT